MIDYHLQFSSQDQHINNQQFANEIQYQTEQYSAEQQIFADQKKFSSSEKQQLQQRYSIKLNGLYQNYSLQTKGKGSAKNDIPWQNNFLLVATMILIVTVMVLALFCSTQKSVLIEKFTNQEEDNSILKLIDQQYPSKSKQSSSVKPDNEYVEKIDLKIQQSSDGIEWPVQDQPYHIYNEVNSQLVLDVATASDGSRDLILYEWKNSYNQKYHFKKVYDNYYHIYNAETKQYMKKSQKFVQDAGVYRVKFEQDDSDLWELVPAIKYGKNAFYILSASKQALDLYRGYPTNGAWIILYRWNKNDNQVWYLRTDQQYFPKSQRSQYKYEQRVSYLLNYIATHKTNINECITVEEIRKEMISKEMIIPYWMEVPVIPTIENSEFKQLMTVQYINRMKGNQEKVIAFLQNTKKKQQKSFPHKQQASHFLPNKLSLECAKNHTIAYIWYGQKQMPEYYIQLLTKCKNNSKLLTEKDYFNYAYQWNQLQPSSTIQVEGITIRQRINLLKLLYLYFESGIYADFDTQIHEQCFQNIMTDQVIFTNRMDENVDYHVVFAVKNVVVPEENFIMVRGKYNPQIKRMIQQQIMETNQKGGRRWRECKYRQCLIIQCQRHYRDNTYRKGYD